MTTATANMPIRKRRGPTGLVSCQQFRSRIPYEVANSYMPEWSACGWNISTGFSAGVYLYLVLRSPKLADQIATNLRLLEIEPDFLILQAERHARTLRDAALKTYDAYFDFSVSVPTRIRNDFIDLCEQESPVRGNHFKAHATQVSLALFQLRTLPQRVALIKASLSY